MAPRWVDAKAIATTIVYNMPELLTGSDGETVTGARPHAFETRSKGRSDERKPRSDERKPRHPGLTDKPGVSAGRCGEFSIPSTGAIEICRSCNKIGQKKSAYDLLGASRKRIIHGLTGYDENPRKNGKKGFTKATKTSISNRSP